MVQVTLSARRWMMLPIGHRTRELDGKALLAFAAAERGWGSIVGSANMRTVRRPRGILIEKNIDPASRSKIEPSLKLGRRVGAWCEEGLVYSNGPEYCARKIDRGTYSEIDVFFCWGDRQAQDIRDSLGSGNKLRVTGNPRFDLHRTEFRPILNERASTLSDEYGPFILVNTRFSRSNGLIPADALIKKMVARGKLRAADVENAKDLTNFHRATFEAFMSLLGALSQRFPGYAVVVRPHPFERMDPWLERARSLRNVHVVRTGNVAEWLVAAEVSIHTNCTTAVEAYLLGRPTISYRPIRDPRFDLSLPSAVSYDTSSLSTVLEKVERVLSGDRVFVTNHPGDPHELVRKHVANLDGASACERILDCLEDVDVAEEAFSVPSEIASTLRKATSTTDEDPAFGPPVDLPSVVALLEAARSATSRFQDVRAAQLSDELVCVFRRD